jgi:hypothetical protein
MCRDCDRNINWVVWRARSEKWNFDAKSAFALEPRKALVELSRFGQSHTRRDV